MSGDAAPSLAERRLRLDARLDRHLAAPNVEADGAPNAPGDARAAFKADIIELYRDVDREIAMLTALKDDVKQLVAKWKEIPAPIPAPLRPVDAGTGAAASTRVDHLGASTFVAKGWTAISVGDHAAAEESLARALELAPDDLEAAALLGWALMGQARHDDALVVLQGVLGRDPSHALARANVGYVCLQKGIFGEAIEHLVRAAGNETDRKAALYATFYLGLVYQRREMFDDAVSFFRRALALGPNLVEARYEMGRALWFGGDRAAAVDAWRAGASAGKFNAWATRCEAMCAMAEQGGALGG